MKVYNVGLIGYGKMGKIYVKEINNNKNYRIVDVLKYKNISKNPKTINNFFKSNKIDLIIISSPINTHFKYLKYAYRFNKNIIIEKPIVENYYEFKKLLQINKNYKKKVMIHHNDILNIKKSNLINKFRNQKQIKKIEMLYGKKELSNSYKKPFFDWLPHPLSVIINFFEYPKNFKIINYSKKIKQKLIIEKLEVLFNFKYFSIILNFSNNLKIPSKKIIIFKKNQKFIYNGYKKVNQKSVKLLLEYFYKKKKINDINKNIKVYELLFKIEKLLSKKIF